ncbi:MAG: DUF5682 family protein [bacterium]|nr:DUF5682 family protein [bacterium]MCM1375511.1 DUF5682 family protein [Muribaculum sp.]
METILRSQEMAEIKLLPVRHHSPTCALQVRRVIESWQPQAVLVEGPDTACGLISAMLDPSTRAPFAVYYSYDDTAGAVTEEKGKYRCYYPFLDYSPELAALRAGSALGAKVAFIDLPYGDILAASQTGKGLRQEGEKSNYNDDYLLSRNAYLRRLCEKTGLRSFDEFWEKYFELEGLTQDSDTWFDNLLTYCRQARESTPPEELIQEGCLAREAYMTKKILDAAAELEGADRSGNDSARERAAAVTVPQTGETVWRRILVVTGGFHTPALAQRLRDSSLTELPKKQVRAADQGAYLMPYSMEAADALNGYASGMPFPGFYQEIWEHMQAGEPEPAGVWGPSAGEADYAVSPYARAVLDMIVATGKAVRRGEGSASTYDEICACSMAQGLAALRGKPYPGAYELQDAVLSCFVKGELTLATDEPMRLLRRQMTGRQVGELCGDAGEPPLLQDFRSQCKRLGLQASSTLETEITLAVFGRKKHRQTSMFFHQLLFLQAPFARRLKGPNLQTGRDRNLIREIWKYKWNAQVMAALIDASVYGGTLEEAAAGLAAERLKKAVYAREGALLFSQVLEMGLEGQLGPVYERLSELLVTDTDFYSLAEALRLLDMVRQLLDLYDFEADLTVMLLTCIRRLTGLLPGMARVRDEDMARCMEAVKLLYQVIGRLERERETDEVAQNALSDNYFEALLAMSQGREIQPGICGCVHGILYGGGREDVTHIQQVCQGYLTGTGEQRHGAAMFFRGLFFAAKDLVFVGDAFLRMLDQFLMQVEERDFMLLLPELHMAFTYFTPAETDRIAQTAAGFHGKSRKQLLQRQAVPESWYLYGRELENFALREMCDD